VWDVAPFGTWRPMGLRALWNSAPFGTGRPIAVRPSELRVLSSTTSMGYHDQGLVLLTSGSEVEIPYEAQFRTGGGVLGALIGAVLAGPFAVLAAAPAAAAAVGIGGATLGAMGGGVVGFDD